MCILSCLCSSAEIYPSPGIVESPDGEELRLFYGAMAYTHDENGSPATGRHNSGVGMASLRSDGFVSINAPRVFNVPADELPGFTTVPLTVPSFKCEPLTPRLVLQANVQTSISGLMLVEVIGSSDNKALLGMALDDADPIRGNFMKTKISWRGNYSWAEQIRGSLVRLRIAMTDTKLYSMSWACAK